MKIGAFGYPGEKLSLVKAMAAELRSRGASKLVCLGGLVWSGRKAPEEPDPPATVLRWLRAEEIDTLANDSDRQVAGWRLQSLAMTTGYIRKNVRRFLSVITREEGEWIVARPGSLALDDMLCCADVLTMDAQYPVPLSRANATRLFKVMKQRVAIFPSANGPELLVRKQEDGAIEPGPFQDIEERLDSPKMAAVIGGVAGYPALQANVSWGALIDTVQRRLTLVCLDARTMKSVPEKGRLLALRGAFRWHEPRE